MSLSTIEMHGANGGVDTGGESGQCADPKPATGNGNLPLKDERMLNTEAEPLDDMETPEIVRAMLTRLSGMPPGQRQRYEREFKLCYYYEGLTVAIVETDRGPAVLASGPDDEVFAALQSVSRSPRGQVTILHPQSLDAVVAELVRVPRKAR